MKKIQPTAQMRSEFEDQEHSWVYGISNVSQYGPNGFQKQTNWETVITNKLPLVENFNWDVDGRKPARNFVENYVQFLKEFAVVAIF